MRYGILPFEDKKRKNIRIARADALIRLRVGGFVPRPAGGPAFRLRPAFARLRLVPRPLSAPGLPLGTLALPLDNSVIAVPEHRGRRGGDPRSLTTNQLVPRQAILAHR